LTLLSLSQHEADGDAVVRLAEGEICAIHVSICL
jgi:hypothetical protein